jgi:pyruvate/2-oxoglutarate dehydrogenase complex dihydrolipoamide dehydrogenase (E3) component
MAKKIVIIGSGSGGCVAVLRVAQHGADFMIIEKENVGGEPKNEYLKALPNLPT